MKKKHTIYFFLIAIAIVIIVSVVVFNFYLAKTENFTAVKSEGNPRNYQLRKQWDENNGYCGETCLITACLRHGQYFSQYDVRGFSYESTNEKNSPQKPEGQGEHATLQIYKPCGKETTYKCQNNTGGACDYMHVKCPVQGQWDNQALIETNYADLSKRLHFKTESWSSSQNGKKNRGKKTKEFYQWLLNKWNGKSDIIIGVYETVDCFAGFGFGLDPSDPNYYEGQPDYDHIVLVSNIVKKDDKKYDLYINDVGNRDTAFLPYFDDDTGSKNKSKYYKPDWWKNLTFEETNYIFKIPYPQGVKTRKESNNKNTSGGGCYTIPNNDEVDNKKLMTYGNVGIALDGILDIPPKEAKSKKLLDINIVPEKPYEFPTPTDIYDDIDDKVKLTEDKKFTSNARPASFEMNLTVNILNLTKDKKYKILKFDNIDNVTGTDYTIIAKNASNNFNSLKIKKNSPFIFKATGNTLTFVDIIKSSDQAIYRGYEII